MCLDESDQKPDSLSSVRVDPHTLRPFVKETNYVLSSSTVPKMRWRSPRPLLFVILLLFGVKLTAHVFLKMATIQLQLDDDSTGTLAGYGRCNCTFFTLHVLMIL